MKTAIGCVSAVLMIASLCVGFYAQYLLYKHVRATETMWILLYSGWFFTIMMQIMAKLIEKIGNNWDKLK